MTSHWCDWLGVQCSALDRREESAREYVDALRLDPLAKHMRGVASFAIIMAGRLDDGMKMAEELVNQHPDAYWGHLALSFACLRKGQMKRAVEEANGADDGSGHPFTMAIRLYVLKAAGRTAEAEETSKTYLLTDGARPWNPSQLAMVHLVMNDFDKAFELLNRAYDDSDPGLIYLGYPPFFDAVRADPRYLELLAKVKPA